MVIMIGIDPGQKGAIGFISFNVAKDKTYDVIDMPEQIGKGLFLILKKIKEDHNSIFCMLEQAQPMPKQGVVGVFTYGMGYGKIKAVLEILEIPYQEVRPAIWKKEFSLIKKDKAASVKVAQQLFPNIEFYTERGRMLDGRAEALLLAEYGRRKHGK